MIGRGRKVQGKLGEGIGWQAWVIEVVGVGVGNERKQSRVLSK